MAMSLHSLKLIPFLILLYFYPSFALKMVSIVFFTPVILLMSFFLLIYGVMVVILSVLFCGTALYWWIGSSLICMFSFGAFQFWLTTPASHLEEVRRRDAIR